MWPKQRLHDDHNVHGNRHNDYWITGKLTRALWTTHPLPSLHSRATAHEETVDAMEAICYASKKGGDPDTLSFRDAMAQPDREEFIKAMVDEVADHEKRKHWELYPRKQVPKGHPIARGVWSMRRKRRLTTGEVYKHKSRLTYDGSTQIHGLNYWDTFSPVVHSFTMKLFFVLALINGWHKRQIDFILAYPQAPAPTDLFMEIPRGFQLPEGKRHSDYCLKLRHNLYGSKQGGKAWFDHLCKGLTNLDFEQSKVDPCVWYRDKVIILFYVDNTWIFSPTKQEADTVFADLQREKFKVDDEGEVQDFLGISFAKRSDGSFHLRQDNLIQRIIKDMNFQPSTKTKDKPANIGQVLHRSDDEPPHKSSWNYRSIIGKLNFLLSTRLDLAYSVHNAARHGHDPRESHTKAVQNIVRYLMGTQDKGMIITPNGSPTLEMFADAEFGGSWDKATAEDDPSTARSRIGYVIRYAGVPIVWVSKLATEICLSTCEAEYVALSESLRSAIPLMQLLDECYDRDLIPKPDATQVRCKVFEDNAGALELAKVQKLRPRTKHLNVKYHHFRSFVQSGQIQVFPIASEDQLADLLTKAPHQLLFLQFRKQLMGW